MNAPHHFRRHAREYGVLVVLAAAAIAPVAVLATRSSDGDGTTGSALPGASVTPQAVELTKKDEGAGGVTVEVTWVTPEQVESGEMERAQGLDLSKELVFLVKMDTHSVDLSEYDLTAISVLRDSEGRESSPEAWESSEESEHHREGLLIFQRPSLTDGLELSIRGLAEVPQRTFRWEALGGSWQREEGPMNSPGSYMMGQ